MSQNRRSTREQTKADEQLNKLMKKFIEFKNKHFVEENGVLVFDAEVTSFKNELKAEWQYYCKLKDKSKNLNYNPKALHNKIEDHMLKHRQLAYVNHVMKLMKVEFAADTKEYDQILDYFEQDISCEQAAYEMANHEFKEA